MTIDIIILFPMIIAGLLGVKDGFNRKIFGALATFTGIILGKIFQQDVAAPLIDIFGCSEASAPTYGFVLIWLIIQILTIVICRLLFSSEREIKIFDRLLGALLGLVQGVVVVSILLMYLALHQYPSRLEASQSRFYRPIINVAPQLFDLADKINAGFFGPPEEETQKEQTKTIDTTTSPKKAPR
jgi:membrane protein required for colicin V production